jgi:U32 family peptidase
MRKIPELLAPAGSMDAVIAAVQCGADAIYCGLHRFSARATAVNFSMAEMTEVIRYCHQFGVKVYITVNTLINDEDMDEVIFTVVEAAKKGADAFIIQDFGLMHVLHQRYPQIELHASTQMHIHHPEQINLLKSAGITRYVIARETPIKTVKEFVQTKSPIEVFIHGALCMSYSGQCQMSYLIGSRSANKGECAQPCRLPYQLMVKESDQWKPVITKSPYLLSTADLNTLNHLDELADAGVASLKIEGRLKRPEYVAAVVKAYRKKLDDPQASIESDQQAMAQMFNRNFTKGHLFDERGSYFLSGQRPNHIGTPLGKIDEIKGQYMFIRLSDDLSTGDGIRVLNDSDDGMTVSRMWLDEKEITSAFHGQRVRIRRLEGANVGDKVHKTTNKSLIEQLRSEIEAQPRIIQIKGKFFVDVEKRMHLIVSDNRKTVEVCSQETIEPAKSQPTSKSDILKQLHKTLDTPYRFEEIEIHIDDLGFIPVSKINALRREALKRLSEQPDIEIDEKELSPFACDYTSELKFRFSCSTADQIETVRSAGFTHIMVSTASMVEYCEKKGIAYLWQTPRIHSSLRFDHASEWCVGEIGRIDNSQPLSGDWSLNVTNIESVKWLLSCGLKSVMLSYECTISDVESILTIGKREGFDYLPCEVGVYGKRELMVLKHCPVASALTDEKLPGCRLCMQREFALKDRMNKIYPLVKDDMCNMHLFEHQPLKRLDEIENYIRLGIRIFRITFTDETSEEIVGIVRKCVLLTKNLQQILNL